MNRTVISIIVPVYKVEQYLSRCLDSILTQTFTEWECILVDDGSPDSSGLICDEYARLDSRFVVFHKDNGGVSSARNLGLDNASGKWVTFVDADDFLSSKFIENLFSPIYNNLCVDFVIGSATPYLKGKTGTPIDMYSDTVESDPAILLNNISGYVWSKLFNKELIDRANVRFNQSIRYSEDMVFTLKYLFEVKRYAFSSEVGYIYNKDNEGSATHTINMEYKEALYVFNSKYDLEMAFIKEKRINEESVKHRLSLLASTLIEIISLLTKSSVSKEERISKFENDISNNDKLHILRFAQTPLLMMAAYCFKYEFYSLGFCVMKLVPYERALIYRLKSFVHL